MPTTDRTPRRFHDRADAGRHLAACLTRVALTDPVVVALPRGGVPVGAEVAGALDAPLDVIVVRKIGAPGHPELGIGAIAEGGVLVIDDRSRAALRLGPDALAALREPEERELLRRVARYRGARPMIDVAGRDVVVVDDGLATGVTATAALRALRALGPRRLILAIPVGAPSSIVRLGTEADEVVAVLRPPDLVAVGRWYDDFRPTTDAEVAACLPPAE